MFNEEIIERYRRLYAGVIYDALCFDLKLPNPFLLAEEIKPAWKFSEPLVGSAFTCRGGRVLDPAHIDDTIRLKMFDHFYKGCVQVISSGGYREVAQFGDISGKIASKFGAVGAVCDAPVRDIKLMETDDFRIFSRGVQPVDAYGKWQITEYEVPIVIPGIQGRVLINPGDLVFGDPDGVIVIPRNKTEEVIYLAEKRQENENLVRREIYHTSDMVKLSQRIGRW